MGLQGVEVVAIAEKDAVRRRELGRRLPAATVFDDFETLLAEAEIDAAVITLPNLLHVAAAVAAFARGLHIYLEKPMAPTLAAAREVVAAWRAAGTTGMIGFNYRFGSMQREARRLVAEGRIGRVVAVKTVFSAGARVLPDWKRRRETGGGALLDLALHHLDLLPWLLQSDPAAISCHLRSVHSEDDTAVVGLELRNGVVAQILATISAVDDDRIEIYGDEGRLVVDRYRNDRVVVHPTNLERVRMLQLSNAARSLVGFAYWRRKLPGGIPEASFREALQEFSRAAQAGRAVTPDLEDGLRSIFLLEAAMRSAAESRTVRIEAEAGED
jgi:myo-inositol 2-dehydrogenase/D-chiro-inositol 1-dehydrogenase